MYLIADEESFSPHGRRDLGTLPARGSAQKAADTARRTSYETACAEAQAAYAARNPHKAGKEGE